MAVEPPAFDETEKEIEMTDRKTSDDVATLAGRILEAGNPFENVQVRAAIRRAIVDNAKCSSPSAIANLEIPEKVIDEIAAVMHPYIDNLLTLAGSAVSQADGK
jgi:hypothetical protein